MVLQGKDKPTFNPALEEGDIVVVINADQAQLSGKKQAEKIYYRHSGVPGNLHKSTPAELAVKFGQAEVLWRAVSGMLPKNHLRKVRCSVCLLSSTLQTLHHPIVVCISYDR